MRLAAVVISLFVLAAGCSSDSGEGEASPTTTLAPSTSTTSEAPSTTVVVGEPEDPEAPVFETAAEGLLADAAELAIGWVNGADLDETTYETVFAPVFRAQVSFPEVAAVLGDFVGGGPWFVIGERFADPQSGQFRLQGAGADDRWDLVLVIDPGEELQINTLFIGPAQDSDPPSDGVEAIGRLEDLGHLRLVVAEVSAGECRTTVDRGADEQMPLASVFKLWVLAALVDAVEAGSVTWDDVVVIRDELDSISGPTTDEPDGTELSVRVLAERMIEVSDNTATDVLIDLLGREAVEAAFVASGHSDPARNRPLLSTRDLTVLKFGPDASLREEWIAADEGERGRLLDEVIVPAELPPLSALETVTSPIEVELIEWFASPNDVCRVLARLATDDEARAVLARNPGVPDDGRWDQILFKGGNEPGVAAAAWLLVDADETFVVAGSVASEDVIFDINEAIALLAFLRDQAPDLTN